MITQSPFLEPRYGLQRVLIMNEGEESGLAYQWPVKARRELRLRRPDGCIFVKTTKSRDGSSILHTMRILDTKSLRTRKNSSHLKLDTPSGFPLHIINNPFLSTPSKDN